MPNPTYFAKGSWNFTCDLCGRKEKSSKAQKTWDGFYVCSMHKEIRNPQDFVKGVADNQSLPWSRPKAPETFPYGSWLLQENGSVLMMETKDFLLVVADPILP